MKRTLADVTLVGARARLRPDACRSKKGIARFVAWLRTQPNQSS